MAISASGQLCVADYVVYLGFPLRPNEVDADVPPHSPCFAVIVFGLSWETQGGLNLWSIPFCVSIEICSTLQVDIVLDVERCGEYSIDIASEAINVFEVMLPGLDTLCEQSQLGASVNRSHIDMQTSEACVHSLQHPFEAHHVVLKSALIALVLFLARKIAINWRCL